MFEETLTSRTPVSDEEAKAALHEFFSSISPSEVLRLYECFYQQLHGEAPPRFVNKPPKFSDKRLKDGGGIKFDSAKNGK